MYLCTSHVGNKSTAPGFLMVALVSGLVRNRLAYDLPTKPTSLHCQVVVVVNTTVLVLLS